MRKGCKRYGIFLIIVIFGIVILFECNRHLVNGTSEIEIADQKTENHLIDVGENLEETDETDKEDLISFRILDGETIFVDENRLEDTYRINNKWSAEEIDKILDSLEGYWETDKYVGFIYEDFYYFGLGIHDIDGLDELREKYHSVYEEKVRKAEQTVPEIQIGVRRSRGGRGYLKENIILANRYDSPFSVILSTWPQDDIYPVRRDATTFSESLDVEYPVMYIKICVEFKTDEEAEWSMEYDYEPATIVITADKQLLLLIDGAFYTLERMPDA